MKRLMKRILCLLVLTVLCSVCASAATIPADGSIWTPGETSTPTPSVPGETQRYAVIVEKTENGTVKANQGTAAAGTVITLTVTPDQGHEVDQLQVSYSGNGKVKVTKISEGIYTFVMPKADVTVKVSFRSAVRTCLRDETCPMYPFTDLDRYAWYHDGVHYCIGNGLMNGVGNNQFDPGGTTTRAMLVTVLWRLEGSPVVASTVKFDDVPAGQWYAHAIAWASANGIVNGYGDGKFGPTNSLTREQVMAIFNRFVAYKGLTSEAAAETQTQCNCSAWAQNDVNWAAANGLLDDLGIDVTNMTAAASRAELATYLYRVIENIMK